MSTSPRIAVRIRADVWASEVERFASASAARRAAQRERSSLEQRGIEVARLAPCAAQAPDGTRLPGLLKTYVPIGDAPASQRPWGFVFDPARDATGLYLELVAFGERRAARPTAKSVYERAHRSLHGRYPPA